MTKTRFEIYKDQANEWRWRLRAHNGKIIADSGEGYSSKANARRAAKALVDHLIVIVTEPLYMIEVSDADKVRA